MEVTSFQPSVSSCYTPNIFIVGMNNLIVLSTYQFILLWAPVNLCFLYLSFEANTFHWIDALDLIAAILRSLLYCPHSSLQHTSQYCFFFFFLSSWVILTSIDLNWHSVDLRDQILRRRPHYLMSNILFTTEFAVVKALGLICKLLFSWDVYIDLLHLPDSRADRADRRKLFRHYTVGSYDSFDASRWDPAPAFVPGMQWRADKTCVYPVLWYMFLYLPRHCQEAVGSHRIYNSSSEVCIQTCPFVFVSVSSISYWWRPPICSWHQDGVENLEYNPLLFS